MNDLNSVLLEGRLAVDPVPTHEPDGTALCTFALLSRRQEKQPDGSTIEVELRTHVLTRAHLAEVCAECLKKGRGVRTVGRLISHPTKRGSLAPLAEHVEFKPEPKAAS